MFSRRLLLPPPSQVLPYLFYRLVNECSVPLLISLQTQAVEN